MGFKVVTPPPAIDSFIQSEIERRIDAVVYKFQYVGESCIKEAREGGNYTDQTGNLRSSIGYIIVKDGQIIDQAIYEHDKGTDRKTGVSQGKQYMESLAAQIPRGIGLIVVAGMNYAAAVESRGKNVLTSARLLAKRLVPQIMTKLGFKVA